jgi:hypothetical protein
MSRPFNPLPWTVVPDQPTHGAQLLVVAADTNVVVRSPEVEEFGTAEQLEIDRPNLEFIVRACNAHDDLVAALQSCDLELQDMREDFHGAAGAHLDAVHIRVAAVLAKAAS